jgi:O-antigen ligase
MPTGSFSIGKIFLAMLTAVFMAMPLASGGLYSFVNSLLVFGLLLFLFCLRLSYLKLTQMMITAFFFLPFNYLPFLNIFNAVNPLTFLGAILATKICLDKVTKNTGPWSRELTNIDRVYFFFLCSAFMSTFFARSKLGALNWIFYSIVTGYVPFKVTTYLEKTELTKIVRTLVILGALCAVEGMGEYFLKHSILFPVFPGRLTSILGHPLVNGMMFSILLPYCLFLYSRTKEKKLIGYAIVYIIAIILTQARGSWLALAGGLFFVFLMAPGRERVRLMIAITLVAAAITAVPLLRNTIFFRAREYEGHQYGSWNIRLKSIPVALDIFKDKPFLGGGPFNAVRYKDEYATNIALRKTAFENSYLGFLVDFGIVGCFLLFGIFTAVLARVVLAARSHKPHGRAMYFVLWSLITMYINLGTFNFDAYRSFSFVVWLFMGLAVFLSYTGPDIEEKVSCAKD